MRNLSQYLTYNMIVRVLRKVKILVLKRNLSNIQIVNYTIVKNKVLDTMEMVMILIMMIIIEIDFIPITNVDILYEIIYIII